MNVGEALLHALEDAGAKALFGIPGDYALPFFDVMEEKNVLPLYTFGHEPAVGYAADAAARHGGGVGVAVVTYGAGALSLVNAVACAWAERSPLVVISGVPGTNEFNQGLLLHHQVRGSGTQMRIFEEITCARAVLDDPETAPGEIARVLRACRRHSRPVYIELPRDMAHAPCRPVPKLRSHAGNKSVARACAQAIAQRINGAKHPVILADIEVRRFGLEEAVAALAEKSGIPLVTTLMGKGMFTKQGTVCRGTYLGMAGDVVLRTLVENSDGLVMLGVIASDTNLGPAGKPIDLSKTIRINAGVVSVGRKEFRNVDLAELVKALHVSLRPRAEMVFPTALRPRLPKESRPLRADDIADIINATFVGIKKMPVAADVGDCLFISMGVRDVPLLASGYYATMGFGVPAGLGIQAATGERPFIIVGDGGFQMTGWELLNCTDCALDPIVLVLNNDGWGMLKQFHPKAGYTSRGDISYAYLAEALGGDGYRASTTKELSEAIEKALHKRGTFQLIEAVLPANDISTTLKRYAEALKSRAALQSAA